MTPGRTRGLMQLAGARGAVALGLLATVEPQERLLVCGTVAPHLTAVALDHETAARALLAGSLPGRCGLAVDLAEPSPPGAPVRLAAGASPALVRRLGASAGFLRLVLQLDQPGAVERELRIASLARSLCHAEDLPLVLQVAVSCAGNEHDAHCAAAMRLVVRVAPDLLVLPLAAGARSRRPWVCALEPGSPDAAADELDRACALGAHGFAAAPLPPPGPLDEATLLERVAPFTSALRARAEEAILAA